MAATFKVGTFNKRSSTGTDSVSGLGFQPKFLLMWSEWAPTNMTINAGARFGMGMASGTAAAEQGSAAWFSADASASSNCGRSIDDAVLIRCDSGGNIISAASLQSFDVDGFTINWTVNAGSTELVHWLAIGGSGFSAKVVDYLLPDTGSGSQAVTGAGFLPDSLFCLAPQLSGFAGNTGISFGFGAASRTFGTASAVGIASQPTQATMNTGRVWSTSAFNIMLDSNNPTTVLYSCAISSWDSDGITMTVSENTAGSADDHLFFAFFDGLEALVTSSAKPTGAAPQNQVFGSGSLTFEPGAAIFFSNNAAGGSSGTAVDHLRLSFGAADEAGNVAAGLWTDPDAEATSRTDAWPSNTRALITNNNVDDTLDAEATATFNAADVTLTWNPNSAEATAIFAVILGAPNTAPTIDSGPSPSPNPTTNTNVTVSFTASDAEQTEGSALTYDIRTAAGGAGSSLGNGVVTSGSPHGHNVSYTSLTIGTATYYLRIGDGFTFTETSFSMTRLQPGAPIPNAGDRTRRAMLARSF